MWYFFRGLSLFFVSFKIEFFIFLQKVIFECKKCKKRVLKRGDNAR